MIIPVASGTSLNFRVVGGTAQPASPKENDIWVNTSTAIHHYDFSAEQPHLVSKNKNLITYPFVNTTITKSGITFTDNGDGTITANGTATAGISFLFSYRDANTMLIPPGTYVLTGGTSSAGVSLKYTEDNWATENALEAWSGTATLTLTKPVKAFAMIWVKSGTKLTNAVFKPQLEKGSSATSFVKGDASGQVWFQTGTSAPASFNALKKNGLTVYPNGCKQYVSGAWVSKTAKTYQSGAWKDWVLYLIKNGDCTEVTGGWTAKHSGQGDGEFEVNADGVYWRNPWNSSNGGNTTITHKTAIDFSAFKSFSFYIARLEGSSLDNLKARIKSTDGTYLAEADFKNGLNKWHSIDLSAVKSKGYVEFYTSAYNYVRVSEAYLS